MGSKSHHEYITFARQIGLVAGTNLLLALQPLILTPILTKNLPIADYGIWVQITVIIALIPSLIMLGLPYTMVRFLAAESSKDEIKEGFYSIAGIIFCTSLITTIILLISSEYVAAVLFNGNTFAVRILAFIVFFECMIAIVINIFRTFQQIKRYSSLLILKCFLNMILISLFIFLHYGIDGAVIGFLLTDIISFVIIFLFIFKKIGFVIPAFTNIKEYLAFGIPTIPSNLSSWVVKSSNVFFIGMFLGTSYVGYYNPGVQLANVISLFIGPISLLLPATLSKNYDDNHPERVVIILEYSLKYLLLITIPVAFGMSILSKSLLTIFTTSAIAGEGYIITPFIAFGAVFMSAYVIFVQIFVLVKKTIITAKIWIFAAIFSLVLNFLLVPIFGITGAAITYFLTFLLVLLVTYYFSKKYLTFNLNLYSFGKYIIASLLMSALVLVFYPKTLLEIGIYFSISVLIYFVSLYILRAVKPEEFRFIKNLFNV